MNIGCIKLVTQFSVTLGNRHNYHKTKKSCMARYLLFGKVAHIAQENLVIGQFAKMNSFHWLRHPWQYLNQFTLSPNEITTTFTSLCTHSRSHSDSIYKSLCFSHKKHKSMREVSCRTMNSLSAVGVISFPTD